MSTVSRNGLPGQTNRSTAALGKNLNPCGNCRKKKQGCIGGWPCERCMKGALECSRTSPVHIRTPPADCTSTALMQLQLTAQEDMNNLMRSGPTGGSSGGDQTASALTTHPGQCTIIKRFCVGSAPQRSIITTYEYQGTPWVSTIDLDQGDIPLPPRNPDITLEEYVAALVQAGYLHSDGGICY